MTTPSDWRTATLPDGREVEYVWAAHDGEALGGGIRVDVTVTIDGAVTTLPVVLTAAEIEEALRRDNTE